MSSSLRANEEEFRFIVVLIDSGGEKHNMVEFAGGQNTQLTPPVSGRDHSQGSPNAPITLVEYGDFECPYCGQAFYVVKQLQQRLGNQLRYVFRNFPLVQVHPYALQAAEAAEAAGAQGKYWQMFDMLFEHQDALDTPHLIQYARDIGLDVQKFEQELQNRTFVPRIEEDIQSGEHSGVQGTPTFFINGVKYNGSYEQPYLLAAIEARAGV
jgi:protein-disulfide isomerase